MINIELQKFNHWLMSNKLTLNLQKSNYIFYKPQKGVKILKLTINNTNIECVDEFNYLGLMLNKHLNWKQQITKIANMLLFGPLIGCRLHGYKLPVLGQCLSLYCR